ncbi:MAG: XRE family transcriptional regulator [Pseudonocardiaceae bacterium]|nr:XRE family transcriptional regulator [Pseudonocardiaceae bacterium]
MTPLPEADEAPTYLAMDRRTARRQLQSGSVIVPGAFAMDALTLGILWALANLDDALLADDTELTECRRLLRTQLPSADISIPPELVTELSATSYGWLGSDSCARYIVRATETFTTRPVFWTREQRGEEASSWLFFRHKLDYLRVTSHRFGSRGDPVVRDFCIPEETVYTSPPAERVLVLLAAALMESLGIRTQVCTDPQLSTVDGFVLAPGTRAVIATWVRTEGRWHVDSTASRSALAAFGTRQAAVHQIRDAPSPVERLTALAGYLGLDWIWVTRRCRELSPHTCAGFARPRSRLLSTEGVDVACRYLAQLADPA